VIPPCIDSTKKFLNEKFMNLFRGWGIFLELC
jgi:hypothetical protein